MSTRSITDRKSFFADESRQKRDARCVEKDLIVRRIIEALPIPTPKAFHAVLMPSLHGPEVSLLGDRGVPTSNFFAVERDPAIHKKLRRRYRGIETTPRPLPFEEAVDYVPFESVDFAYLDFFGQPDAWHLVGLVKLLKLGLLGRGAHLVVTFGTNRGDPFAVKLNHRLKVPAPQAYVEAALARCGRRHKQLINYRYLTNTVDHPANFITTEVTLR